MPFLEGEKEEIAWNPHKRANALRDFLQPPPHPKIGTEVQFWRHELANSRNSYSAGETGALSFHSCGVDANRPPSSEE